MKKTICSLLLLAFLSGCAGSPARTGWKAEANREKMILLEVGMTKEEVQKIMGTPGKTEVYPSSNGNVEFWLYLTEMIRGSGIDDSHYTPFAFKKGKLQGWGRNYYNDVLKIEQDITIKNK